jgi:FtsX-like permease family protein/integrase-like protein/MacB-like protein
VTQLLQDLREELTRRDYAPSTIRSYVQIVEAFRQHTGARLDRITPVQLRRYHLFLLEERRLAVGTVVTQICALRFFCRYVLKRRDVREDLPYPKQRLRLPVVLSPDEVQRLIAGAKNLYHRTLLLTLYGAGLRPAVIVNETFARRHFPGENPIGRTLVTGMAQLPSQIVGVVADVRSASLNAPPDADYFLPALQRPEAFTNILVRSRVSAAAILPALREAVRSVDPDLPLLQAQPLSARIAQTVADRKLALMLLGGFAVLALVLASLGVYSVMAHLVTFRTREIGLRMALGASPGVVMRMVLGHGRRLTLVGIAVGIAGALAMSRLLQQTLFEVDAASPVVYLALSVFLLLVTECASWFPARRATRIDPVIALRAD